MKISATVIAHNEEEWIEKCILSLLQQTVEPDEIIILAHNCSDKTIEIASKYPVKVEILNEGVGTIYSRAKAIEVSTGDVVCCTDGDCWADKNWIKNISEPLIKNKSISIVGGYTKIQNGLFWKFSCWWQFVINRKLLNNKNNRFAWGSNFALRKKDYEKTGGLLPFLDIKKDLKLNYDAEDLYISLALQQIGKIFFALNANIYTYMPKEKASIKAQKTIIRKQLEDNKKLFTFFKF